MNKHTDLQTVLAQCPLGLALDIDGTLSPIAPTPDEARLYPGVLPLLERAREHAHVAIMTGRAIDDGASLDAVQEIERMRKEGTAALAIVVRHPDTLSELLQQADIVVQKVPGRVDLLREMVEMLETLPGPAPIIMGGAWQALHSLYRCSNIQLSSHARSA